MKGIVIASLGIAALAGCSSYKPQVVDNKKTIEKDYKVTDASSRYRPTWIEDPSYWSKKEKQDTENWNFFSYETSPKADRELACDLARANAKADIAAEIKTDVTKQLDSLREDGQTALSEGGFVRSYIERSLQTKVAQNLVGARTEKVYWEKRAFSKKLGAIRDGVGFTCAVLTKIQKKNLELAIDRAFNSLYQDKKAQGFKDQIKTAVKQTIK